MWFCEWKIICMCSWCLGVHSVLRCPNRAYFNDLSALLMAGIVLILLHLSSLSQNGIKLMAERVLMKRFVKCFGLMRRAWFVSAATYAHTFMLIKRQFSVETANALWFQVGVSVATLMQRLWTFNHVRFYVCKSSGPWFFFYRRTVQTVTCFSWIGNFLGGAVWVIKRWLNWLLLWSVSCTATW